MNVFNTQANIFKVNGGLADIFANRPAPTGSYYIFWSIDTAEIFYDDGTWIQFGGGGGGGFYFSDTYANIAALKAANNLVPGAMYFINDKNIVIAAVSNNSFFSNGTRIENIIEPNQYNILQIWRQSLVVVINQFVIWGGVIWQNISGTNVLPSVDVYTLDSLEWQKVPFSSNKYTIRFFEIIYLFDTDIVATQYDAIQNNRVTNWTKGVVLNSSDWGNINNTDNIVWDGFLNNIGNVFANNCSGIFNNTTNGGISYNNIKGVINNNDLTGEITYNNVYDIINNFCNNISNNSNTGLISNNNIIGNIELNINNGSITSNTITGDITKNSNAGNIQNNQSNVTLIEHNSNTGNINNNNNTGVIQHNSNAGNIANNTCLSITNNYCGGNLSNNSNIGNISSNNVGGPITGNSNGGAIFQNSNAAGIQNNSNTSQIYRNKNNGQILGITNITAQIFSNVNNGDILVSTPGNITDPIINK